jgi:hypothetical protein
LKRHWGYVLAYAAGLMFLVWHGLTHGVAH